MNEPTVHPAPPAGGILALDFDGVLCDSAAETGVTAWRAGRELWPEWQGSEPFPELLARFCKLRPLLETGFEAIALLRWIADGLDTAAIRERFAAGLPAIEATTGRRRTELVGLFGSVRDRWIAAEPADWLARQRFYPGVAEALRSPQAPSRIAILTTKQERFVRLLCEREGVTLAAAQIRGLESGRPKEDWLAEWAGAPATRENAICFVEDRLPALKRVAARPGLAAVRLCFAEWGYSLPEEQEQARVTAGVECLTLDAFLQVLRAGCRHALGPAGP